ncbi:MAG TPA: HEAT repeat domain-containing protein [Spirochaetia bacterium]
MTTETQVGPAEVARTGKVLLLSTQPSRRAWAARCLGMSGQVAAYAWLRRALMDPDEDVRVCVVEAVGLLGVAQAAGELAALYAWSGPRVRRSVIRAAARMAGVPGWAPLLRLALDDTDGRIRAMAVRAMRVGAQRRL